jgi:TolB protein
MHADGTDSTNISRHAKADRHPDWSPDGTKIAFTSDREGKDDIYVMDDDGSNPVNLTQNQAGRNRSPAWQPIPLAVSPQEKLVTLWGNLKSKQ